MTRELLFTVLLVVTVALLAGVIVTGFRARRRAHLVLVFTFLAAFLGTVWAAERLGELYDLEAAGAITPVHLFFAKAASFSFVGPLVTGALTIRNPVRRPLHRLFAFLAIALTLVAAVTGAWMILASERIA